MIVLSISSVMMKTVVMMAIKVMMRLILAVGLMIFFTVSMKEKKHKNSELEYTSQSQ